MHEKKLIVLIAVFLSAGCMDDDLGIWFGEECRRDPECETGEMCLAGRCEPAEDSGPVGSSDGDADADTDAPVKPVRGEPCDDYDPDKNVYDYGAEYPRGPYGFKGSVCWNERGSDPPYYWGGGGDTLHNICLPNQDDETVCMSDLVGGEKDLLIIIFSARW